MKSCFSLEMYSTSTTLECLNTIVDNITNGNSNSSINNNNNSSDNSNTCSPSTSNKKSVPQ